MWCVQVCENYQIVLFHVVMQPGSLGALVAATVMAQQQQQQQQPSPGIQSSMANVAGSSGVLTSTANTVSSSSPMNMGVQGMQGIPALGNTMMLKITKAITILLTMT